MLKKHKDPRVRAIIPYQDTFKITVDEDKRIFHTENHQKKILYMLPFYQF